MEDKTQKFNSLKYAAIALMAVAVLMLCMNWFKLGDEIAEEAKEACEELEEDLKRDMEYLDADDLEEILEEEGYSSGEIKKLIKATEGMYGILGKAEKAKFSVVTIAGMNSDISDMKLLLEDGDLIDATEEDVMMISVIQTVLTVLIAVFVIDGVLMLLAIYCYMQNKKAYGVIAVILSGLMLAVFGLLTLAMNLGSGETFMSITPAPFLAFACSLASCIVWKGARRMLEGSNQY